MVRGRGSGEPPWLHDVPRVPPTAACVHWPRNHATERNCSTMQAHAVPGQDCNTNGRLSAILFCMYGLVVLESNTFVSPRSSACWQVWGGATEIPSEMRTSFNGDIHMHRAQYVFPYEKVSPSWPGMILPLQPEHGFVR